MTESKYTTVSILNKTLENLKSVKRQISNRDDTDYNMDDTICVLINNFKTLPEITSDYFCLKCGMVHTKDEDVWKKHVMYARL